MNRRETVLTIASLGAIPLGVVAQQPGKLYRIGFITPGRGIDESERGFRRRMSELGYIEGRNLAMEWRFASGDVTRFPAFARELVGLQPDCIVTIGLEAALAVKKESSTIPVVLFNIDIDPVKVGLVTSLARPGGNVTGVVSIGAELAAKRVEFIKESMPKAARLGIFFDTKPLAGAMHAEESEAAAGKLNLRLFKFPITSPESLERQFKAASDLKVDMAIVVAAGLTLGLRQHVVDLALKHRIPIMATISPYADAGALMTYGADRAALHNRTAEYADRILKGAKPGDIPIEQPTRFELLINLKTARQLGIAISPALLARADRVIE